MSEQYISFPGTAGNFVSTDGNPSIVGDLDLRAKIAFTDWTAEDSDVIAIWGGAQSLVRWRMLNNTLRGTWIDDGDNLRSIPLSDALGLSDEVAELRTTIVAASGVTAHYLNGVAAGGGTMTTTGAGNTSNSDLQIGTRDAGTGGLIDGDVYWAEVRDGIDGDVVARYDAADAYAAYGGGLLSDSATWTGSVDGLTWTVNGSGLYVWTSGDNTLAGPGQLLVTGG